MSLVVADASPLRYLIVIDAVDVLPKLFDRIIAPEYVVISELRHPKTPPAVEAWVTSLPTWFELGNPARTEPLPLHRGEVEAIALARELNADALLLDDAAARRHAVAQGLPVVGTVGVLERAAELDLLVLADAFDRLLRTNFRISGDVVRDALARDAARHRQRSE